MVSILPYLLFAGVPGEDSSNPDLRHRPTLQTEAAPNRGIAMRVAETSGRTADEAIDKALAELGLRRDQVDVDVVTEGRAGGFLGFGAEPARVRVTERAPAVAPGSAADAGADGGEAGSEDRPPRRRRGRRGGRGRRDRGAQGEGVPGEQATGEGASDEAVASVSTSEGDSNPGPDAVQAAPSGGNRGARDGGRSRGGRESSGREGSGRESSGRGNGSRDRREPAERRERSTEPIVGVSDDEAVAIPGTPDELPYAPIEDPADDMDLSGATLRDLLTLLGYTDTEITARDPETPGDGVGMIEQIFDIYGTTDDASDELGVLIGRRGETLAALQYLINTIVSKGGNKPPAFGLDIEGYRRRREEMLVDLARDIAQEVRETGDVITLEPMPANERRIVHIALREEDGVRTESVGAGDQRQVEVLPE
ncbi:MAG: Jag N-terminal domain-containing protein [Dehalococcoidia bacterium]